MLAGALALTSVVRLARTPFPGKSRLLPMVPALLTLAAAVGTYAAGTVAAMVRGDAAG